MLILVVAYIGGQLFGALRMNVMHILGQRFVYNLRLENLPPSPESLALLLRRPPHRRHHVAPIQRRQRRRGTWSCTARMRSSPTSCSAVGVVYLLFKAFWSTPLIVFAGLWPLPLFVAGIVIFSKFVRPIYRKIREGPRRPSTTSCRSPSPASAW